MTKLKLKMTDERKRRVIQAMKETQSVLDAELKYSEDLQKKDNIAFYKKHIKKLENMLKMEYVYV
jgi:hypothetical protein